MAVVSFTVDGVTRAVDLTNARRIEVLPPKTPTEFPFSLAVKKADVAINSTGKITLTNAPDNAPGTPLAISHIAAPSITPPKLDADRVTIPLPAPADEVIVAGSGRYLVFDSRTLNQLTVFDVNTGRIAGSMKMPTAERRIAAGGDALFVLTLNREVVRWDLRTMTKDRTISLETDGAPTGITMGYASNGPLVITTNKGLMFYDPTTLARLKITVREDGANALRDWSLNASPDLWTSADGMTVVSGTANSNGFSGGLSGRYRFLTLDSGTAVVRTQTLSQAAPPLLPSHDGNQLLSGNGLVSIRDLTVPSPEQFRDMQLLPAIASNLIVATRRVAFLQDRGQEIPKLSVFSLNEPRALFTIPDLTELTRPNTETPQRGGFARGATAERGGAPVPNTPTPQRGGFGGRAGGGGGPATRGGFNEFASQRTSTPSSQIVGGQPGATAGNLEKRIFLIPSADLLVTLSYARDALVLRRIRIDDELKKSGGDYLFVANTVPRNAEKGKPYRYAMDIKSGTGGLTYKLESGPAGMTVDLDGVVTWNVPVSAASRTPVVISVRSRSGKEITHTFFIDAR
jgi:hypothetical protein